MRTRSIIAGAMFVAGVVAASSSALVYAQSAGQSLGSVRLPAAVRANGQPLAAGTYTVRLTADNGTPVVGQSTASARWVEFVQGGQVKGRELATVVAASDIARVGKTKTPPGPGTSRVELLKGADYLRVWCNSGGTHYLVHLAATAK